jgi:hypothetical protein
LELWCNLCIWWCLKSSGSKWCRWRLRDRAPASHGLYFLDLKLDARLFANLLTETLIFLIDVKDQFLHVIASNSIFVEETRADAQMQRLVTLFLARTLLKPGAFTSESEFDDFLLIIVTSALAADLNDSLHVASFGSD